MNALMLPVTFLPGSAPQGPIIPAQLLARHFEAADVLEHARREAATQEEQGRAMLAEASRDAQRIREDARAQGIEEAQGDIEEARTHALATAVNWLVEEETLEEQIASRLEERIREMAIQALTEFISDQDLNDIFVQRLKQKVAGLVNDGRLTLRVHPEQVPEIQNAFAGEARVAVIADDTVSYTDAILDTPLVTLQLSLERHLDLLLSRLNGGS